MSQVLGVLAGVGCSGEEGLNDRQGEVGAEEGVEVPAAGQFGQGGVRDAGCCFPDGRELGVTVAGEQEHWDRGAGE